MPAAAMFVFLVSDEHFHDDAAEEAAFVFVFVNSVFVLFVGPMLAKSPHSSVG